MEKAIYELSQKYTAPIVYEFVKWILRQALAKKIDTIYFLARDGYVPSKIAQMICEHDDLPLKCKYLYCSRNALRLPSYHFLDNEAYELIFTYGLHVTIRELLAKVEIPDAEQDKIMKEIGFPVQYAEKECSDLEVAKLADCLKRNETFNQYMWQRSRARFDEAIGYFRQEGLFEQETIILVDSGWSGSLQRSMRQLMEHAGYKGKFIGFYFGLLKYNQKPEDGKFYSWYLNEKSAERDFIFFNTELFETMLSAPHATTLFYEKDDDKYKPVLGENILDENQQNLRSTQIRAILDWVGDCLHKDKPLLTQSTGLYERLRIKWLIYRLMVWPSRKMAEVYGSFTFADDMMDQKQNHLTGPEQCESLRIYNVYQLFCRENFGRYSLAGVKNICWPFGTVSFLPNFISRLYYRLNIFVWHKINFARAKRKTIIGYRVKNVCFKVLMKLNTILWKIMPVQVLVWYLSRYEIISFDVFDTLVFRKCDKPSDIFDVLGRKYGVVDFKEKRIKAEQKARQLSGKPSGEISIYDIYQCYSGELPMDKTLAVAKEIDVEKEYIFANPFMKKVFVKLMERNKRVIVVSDMYLPGKVLNDILQNCGYTGFEALFVSGDVGCNKWFGELQNFAIKQIRAENCSFVHIGDNYRIDYVGTHYANRKAIWYLGKK